jgi:hypothetical protein
MAMSLYLHPRPLHCYADLPDTRASRYGGPSLFAELARDAKIQRLRNKALKLSISHQGDTDHMAKERKFQEVTNDLPPVWGGEEPLAAGSVLEGIYIGAMQIKYRNKPFLTHQIQNEATGEVLSFSGAIADRKMGRVPKGAFVRVTFLGFIETANSPETKDFKVEADSNVKLQEAQLL